MITIYKTLPMVKIAHVLDENLAQGLEAAGVEFQFKECADYRPDDGDIAMVHGWKKEILAGKPYDRAPIIDGQLSQGKHVICMERGLYGNREDFNVFAWDGLHGSGRWDHIQDMPPDRWESHGMRLEPWSNDGEEILVCAQVPWDANVNDVDHLDWLEETMHLIRDRSNRPIAFRAHPKIRNRHGATGYGRVLNALPANTRICDSRQPVHADLQRAFACVCWNSNTAMDAVIAGVPAFTFHKNAIAYEVTCHDLDQISDPPRIDREQWAWNLAYKQWTMDEVASGKFWHCVGKGQTVGAT